MTSCRAADLMDLTLEYWRLGAEFTMKLLFPWASPVDRVNRKPNVVLVNDSNSTYGVRPAGEEDQHDPFSWPVWQAQPRTHVWYRDQQMEELDDPERATVGYFN